MKKITVLFLALILTLSCVACNSHPPDSDMDMEPQISQIRSICELSVMECYYHNVAKFKEENVEGMLLWKKDKHFWIEYSGVVELGIDASLVTMEVTGNTVTITIPEAKVLNCTVDSSSLSKDSFIVDQNSAAIKAEDESRAFQEAQKQMETTAASDKTLLSNAQQRAQTLLANYINNLGDAIGKEYSIQWIYLDAEGNKPASTSKPSADNNE